MANSEPHFLPKLRLGEDSLFEITPLVISNQDFNHILPDMRSMHFALCHLVSWDLHTLSIFLVLNKYLILIASITLHITVSLIPTLN